MKVAGIFRQYIWLVETIHRFRRITLSELNELWVKTEMSGGIPMHRSLFNRHRKAIEEMFGLCIECKRSGNEYPYYIENEEALLDDNIQHWMLDSLSISNLLMESQSLKDRIILEKIPAGKQFLKPCGIGIVPFKFRCDLPFFIQIALKAAFGHAVTETNDGNGIRKLAVGLFFQNLIQYFHFRLLEKWSYVESMKTLYHVTFRFATKK